MVLSRDTVASVLMIPCILMCENQEFKYEEKRQERMTLIEEEKEGETETHIHTQTEKERKREIKTPPRCRTKYSILILRTELLCWLCH